jgi:hypothetical protein
VILPDQNWPKWGGPGPFTGELVIGSEVGQWFHVGSENTEGRKDPHLAVPDNATAYIDDYADSTDDESYGPSFGITVTRWNGTTFRMMSNRITILTYNT